MLKSFRRLWKSSNESGEALSPKLPALWQKTKNLPWGQWLRFRWVAPGLERLTTIVLKLGTLLLVCFFLIFFLRLFRDQGYVIQSVSVPKQLMEQGYTGEVVALRIQDELAALKELAVTVRVDSLQLKGDQQDIDLSVLGVGLSLRTLAFQLREALGRENKTVRGEITRIGNRLEAQVRMTGYDKIDAQVDVQGGREAAALQQLFRQIAEGILYETDPYRLALVQRTEGRYDEAIATIRYYLRTREHEAHWAYLCWGSLLRTQGDEQGAIDKFERAIALKPDFPLPYVNLAWAYNSTDRPLDAIAAMKKVVELEPENVWRRNNLAWLYFQNDFQREADSVYEHSLSTMDLDPVTKADFAASWAEMKFQEDGIVEAKRIIDKYVEVSSENVFSYIIKGVAALAEKDTVQAMEHLRSAFEIDPGHQGAIGSNMGFNMMLERYDQVVHFYRQADWSRIGEGNRINNWNKAAMAYNHLAQHDSALVTVNKAIALNPNVAYPYTTLAETYFYTGQRDSCFHYFELALDMGFNPENFELDLDPYTYLVEVPEFQALLRRYTNESLVLKN